ncbi:hypothetical protein HK099_005481 [Clydaea vesicula]|uniref:LysM domain-containing protein n=1 Tax=Clydaea vesicula TaxID=447962 RepID=A0AAD5TZ19_9FUNG|nr:hypothetical protein HK099_005481 [Clydaea vesicula]KAJ3393603.1 hypothetical protein HDU92_007642 [Lobulomyces angularis]
MSCQTALITANSSDTCFSIASSLGIPLNEFITNSNIDCENIQQGQKICPRVITNTVSLTSTLISTNSFSGTSITPTTTIPTTVSSSVQLSSTTTTSVPLNTSTAPNVTNNSPFSIFNTSQTNTIIILSICSAALFLTILVCICICCKKRKASIKRKKLDNERRLRNNKNLAENYGIRSRTSGLKSSSYIAPSELTFANDSRASSLYPSHSISQIGVPQNFNYNPEDYENLKNMKPGNLTYPNQVLYDQNYNYANFNDKYNNGSLIRDENVGKLYSMYAKP